MNLDEFSQQLGAARQRVGLLNQYARKSLVLQQELLLGAFEELYAALEDLQVAQEELRQQNEELAAAHGVVEVKRHYYQNLFKFAPDAYLVTDVQGTIREANRAAARLLNVPQQFLVGKPLVIFISQQERRAFRTELTKLHQHDQESEWGISLSPRGGEPIDATVKVTVVHQEGRLLSLGWLLRVTEHKQASAPLWLLSSAVQHANEAIVITSAELDYPGPKYIFVNPAFTKMTGYTIGELTGKTPRILQGPKTDRSVLDLLRRNLLQGQLFHGEMTNYHKNGTEYNVELCCFPIHNEREITHFISIARDITNK